ncbi:E3 ubiquitin-protein ligase XIAP-like [Biomphalaria glabrata]|uniref:E3 ubiquitin-protein ligase XIAP-like n=1 Tax=Biomphalaria glabrata TaxID=6526 RepID=A0A9W3A696_BIOGL|nr:E3 ubiquitin-protein ligase XIAP-like [Biomphalaria glabrata]XP_055882713.1 E3 ubiquitin-protein ligase XIAP-like [Biomphalaria glabrata]XP_055882714.1 E3 ubiquitin-protein ligase XIAP-like [Biomphalaria glabrata]
MTNSTSNPGMIDEINISANSNDEKHRLASFANIPPESSEHPVLLSQNGFVFIGAGKNNKDAKVICFSCRKCVLIWQGNEDICKLHQAISPDCPMLKNQEFSNIPMQLPSQASEAVSKAILDKMSVDISNRHIDLHSFQQRLETFSSWPSGRKSTPQSLAQAVFFFVVADVLELRTPPHYHKVDHHCTNILCLADIPKELSHPRFRLYKCRLATLLNDLRPLHLKKKHMIADAGYFYSDINHSFICFCCADVKFTFSGDDIVVVEHARSSPQCGYLRQVVGDRFIHIVQQSERHDSMPFNLLKPHLTRYDAWFTEEQVTERQRVDPLSDSTAQHLVDFRRELLKCIDHQKCGSCSKGNSAVKRLSCCEIVCCVDCFNSSKRCECQHPLESAHG